MATFESIHGIETETSIAHNQGQPASTLESENAPGASIPALVARSDRTPPHSDISSPEGHIFHQPALTNATGEMHDISNILSPALITVIREEPGRKVALKDISLECSVTDHLGDELMLVVMRDKSSDILCLTTISPTTWKAVDDIECDHTAGDIMLVIQSQDGGDEAFLTLTSDEIYAMSCTEEGTLVESMLKSVKEDNAIKVKMSCTVWSSSMLGENDATLSGWFTATAFQLRFNATGNIDDINQAILHGEKAMSSHPPSLEFIPEMPFLLGNAYYSRFERTRNLEDINRAISHQKKAVESTPSGHTELPSRYSNLGSSYARRFQRTGNLQDINMGISHHQRAFELTPSGHTDLPRRLNNLGSSYLCRFERTGSLQDIDRAISHHQKSVQSIPAGHADISKCYDNLGSSHKLRFERTGNLHDINCAISHQQKAIESTPSSDAVLPILFNNLGNSYLRRFERTKDIQDIDCAISHHQEAVKSTFSGHADLPKISNNLGNSYLCRFKCTKNLQDIDFAISYHRKAVDSTPSGHVDLPSWFSNLGLSYSQRFDHTGDLQDISHSISYQQKAIEYTPFGHAVLPGLSNNLGNSYSYRFKRTEDLQDIDCAIFHHQKAVESTSPGHVNLPGLFTNLGDSYSYRFDCTHYVPDVQNSINAYCQGAHSDGSPSVRLTSAKKAVMYSSVHDRSHFRLDDSGLAISLIAEVAGLDQTIDRRYANLHGHSDFVKYVVAIAFHLNRFDLALEWLEQGRCLVWNQFNQLRTPIDDLRLKNSTLADRFMTAASALEYYGSRSIPSTSSHAGLTQDIRLQNDTRNHTLHATQYRQILEEIRTLPDFQNFLRPPKATDILESLPSDGPIIIFNLQSSRCDVLALVAGIEEPVYIPLENFSLEQAEKLQETLRFDLLKHRDVNDQDRLPRRVRPNSTSMSFVLQELWCKVVQPILEALGYSSQINPSDRRRIWWCPTGPLAFLPLHAAGIYGSCYTPGSCISDFAVSSYTPTVQSLIERSSTSSVVPKRTSLVLIGPNSPNLPPIPFARAEIHDLKALVDQFDINASLLEDAAATTDAVKRELNSHNWVHFACHGIQDMVDPLKSGVHLHDGRLELLEIMRQKLSNAELAFLSACQTSKGDLKLSEEVVHLAAGMLAAGYRGVIGTMWSISDLHGPEFSRWFYRYLLEEKGSEGLDSTRAAYALDYATRKVRETLGESDVAFLTWVPYVHFGY